MIRMYLRFIYHFTTGPLTNLPRVAVFILWNGLLLTVVEKKTVKDVFAFANGTIIKVI